MADLMLYGLKSCDTCRKSLKTLEAGGRDAAFVDLRADDDLAQRLPGWLDAAGAERLINTRSTSWRGLSEAERARAETDPAGLLSDHPALIKRPVIETADGAVHVGWTAEVRAALGVSG